MLFCAAAGGSACSDRSGATMTPGCPGAEIRTFRYSIVYLGALFLALLVDHYLPALFP